MLLALMQQHTLDDLSFLKPLPAGDAYTCCRIDAKC